MSGTNLVELPLYDTPGLEEILDRPEPEPDLVTTYVEGLTPAEIEQLAREELRRTDEELCRRDFGEFIKLAAVRGLLPGVHKLDWAGHLEAMAYEGQMLVEGWLVANGRGTPEMVLRQADAWASTGATWDDVDAEGESLGPLPEPWLRHVLVQNYICNVPPGTLKSTILMVCLPAWAWLHAPDLKFACLSAVDKNVRRDSNAHRKLVTSEWYAHTFGIKWRISQLEDAVDKWVTTAGGERISITLVTGLTGTHVHIILVDDPDDADKVWNEPIRRNTQDRWTDAAENRVIDERTALRIILQQRVHVDDLTAYLLAIARWAPHKRNGWMQLCIPMEAGRQPIEAPKRTAFGWEDWRTKAGQLLQPQRFTPTVLADKREKMQDGYDGQYNCNPQPLTAGMFARGKLRFFLIEGTPEAERLGQGLRKRPEGCLQREELEPVVLRRDKYSGKLKIDWLAISVDPSNGGEATTSSACGLLAIAGAGAHRYVLDDRTAVMGIQEMYDTIGAMLARWGPEHDGETKVLVEWKAAGASVVNEITRQVEAQEIRDSDGRAVIASVEPIKLGTGDGYIARARAIVPTWNACLVHVLDGAEWLFPKRDDEGFIGEVCPFPNARKDDRVDALDQCIIHYAEDDGERAARALNRL